MPTPQPRAIEDVRTAYKIPGDENDASMYFQLSRMTRNG
jgi:hypothetical protein